MFKRKRLIIFVAFLIILFFMTMYAGSPRQNETIATRTVKFIDSYNNAEVSSQKIEVGKEASVPGAPDHNNLVFIGWYDGETLISKFDNIMKDLTVYAKYAEDINNNNIADNLDTYYSVVFYDTVANNNIREVRVLSGMNATAPAVPMHDGYTFTGWSRGFTNVRGNITVNTQYRLIEEVSTLTTYKLTFVDGFNNTVIEVLNVEEGYTANPPTAPKHPKKVFIGWDKDFSNVTGEMTLTALYADDINENNEADDKEMRYGITFAIKGNGNLTGEKEFKNLLSNLSFYDNVTIPDAKAEEGYTFMGWSPVLPVKDSKVSESVIYMAIFEDITLPVGTLNYSNKGNPTKEDVTVTLEVNENIIAPNGWTKINDTTFTKVFNENINSTLEIEDLAENKITLDLNVTGIDKDKPIVEIQNMDNFNPTSFDVITEDQNSRLDRIDYSLWTNNNSTQLGVWGETINGNVKEFNKTNIKEYKKDGVSKLFSDLPEGEYTLRVTARDKALNSKDAISFNFKVDHTNPTVKINLDRKSYLTNGGYANEISKPEVEARDKNLDGFGVYDETGKRVAGPKGENVEERRAVIGWLSEGTYTVVAVDKAGNESKPFKITIDKTSPAAKITLQDKAGNLITENGIKFGKEVTVIGEVAASEKHIQSHWFEIKNPDGSLSYAQKMGTNDLSYSFTLDTSKGSGEYQIRYVATDKAGNRNDDPGYTNSTIKTLIVDATAPIISSVTALNYNHKIENNYYDNEPIKIEVTATDNFEGKLLYQYGSETKWVESNTYTREWTADNFTVKVKDEMGNIREATIGIHIDKEPMNINFVTTNNENYNGDYTQTLKPIYIKPRNAWKLLVSGYLWSEKERGVSKEEINNSFWHNDKINNPTENGNYYLWVYALDYHGNEQLIRSNAFIIDKIKPEVEEVKYSPESLTNQDVVATITFNEEVEISNTDWKLKNSSDKKVWQKTYLSDANETVNYVDLAGNPGDSIEININYIDKIKPNVIDVNYSSQKSTNEDVIVTITFDKKVEITASGWTKVNTEGTVWSNTYTSNKNENVQYKDMAGNVNSVVISIDNIDKIKPTIFFSGANPLKIGLFDFTFDPEKAFSATDDVDGDITGKVKIIKNDYKWWKPGNYEIVYEVSDEAGNVTQATRNIKVTILGL